MARKQAIAIQETIKTDEDYEQYLETHKDQLICMEVYSEFCGPCLATGNAIRRGKMEIGQDNIAMVKCPADRITALKRFKDHSEPAFLFIVFLKWLSWMVDGANPRVMFMIGHHQKGKLVRAMFGPNGIDLCRIIEEELKKNELQIEGIPVDRTHYEVEEMLPEEAEKQQANVKIEEEYQDALERLRVLTLAARKKRVNERLARQIRRLNFILFWPHCHGAHHDLYEKWDYNNITVAAKETVQLDEAGAKEALYMSDVDPNEACLHALFAGEALVVLFKMMDSDMRDFVQLMRYTLYVEIPIPKEDVPPEKQLPPIPAYERYASISKTAREIRRDRYNAKMQKLQEEKEEAERLASEQARIARDAAEEEARLEKIRLDEERMARIAAGLPADPVPVSEPEPGEGEQVVGEEVEGIEGEVKEGEVIEGEVKEGEVVEGDVTEKVETEVSEGPVGDVGEEVPPEEVVPEVKEEVFDSDVEVEGEDFIPAGGLFVPGLYSPANDLARACGLSYFFPKQVKALVETMETEFLPPHVLVIFNIEKRYDVMEVVKEYSSEILNMGVFVGEDPYKAEHVAYTIKQYDKIIRPRKYYDRLALMVSRKRSLALLQLAGLNPVYISSDVDSGEKECLAMFPVGYGDEYVEEESIKEEEAVIVELPKETVKEVVEVAEEKKAEDEEEEEEEGHEATL